jgi:hypothetical protein
MIRSGAKTTCRSCRQEKARASRHGSHRALGTHIAYPVPLHHLSRPSFPPLTSLPPPSPPPEIPSMLCAEGGMGAQLTAHTSLSCSRSTARHADAGRCRSQSRMVLSSGAREERRLSACKACVTRLSGRVQRTHLRMSWRRPCRRLCMTNRGSSRCGPAGWRHAARPRCTGSGDFRCLQLCFHSGIHCSAFPRAQTVVP